MKHLIFFLLFSLFLAGCSSGIFQELPKGGQLPSPSSSPPSSAPQPDGGSLPLSEGLPRILDIAAVSGIPCLATEEGPICLFGEADFVLGESSEVTFCGRVSKSPDRCAGSNVSCSLPEPRNCFGVESIEAVDPAGEIYAIVEKEYPPERRVIVSQDERQWQVLPESDAVPLALRSKGDRLYLLNEKRISSRRDGKWERSFTLSQEFQEILSSEKMPGEKFLLEVYEDDEAVFFFVGTPKGLYQNFYHLPTGASSFWSLVGPPITAMTIDSQEPALYFSFVSGDRFGPYGEAGIVKMDIQFLDWNIFAPLPEIYDLDFAEEELLAVGWDPASVFKDSMIYKIDRSGVFSHLYSQFQTLGLPPLSDSEFDHVGAIGYERGHFYAALTARGCLFEADGVPSPELAGRCFGE